MPRIDPILVPVVFDLECGLRELGVPFGIVGALVPELLLDVRPNRMTNDADVAVVVESLADFDLLKDQLADYRFTRTHSPHRLQHRDGGLVDILPFSEAIAPDGYLELEEGFVLNMAGFSHVVPSAVSIPIEGGPTLPLAHCRSMSCSSWWPSVTEMSPRISPVSSIAWNTTLKTTIGGTASITTAKACPTSTLAPSVTSHVICRIFNGSLLVVERRRGGWHEALRGDFGEGRA